MHRSSAYMSAAEQITWHQASGYIGDERRNRHNLFKNIPYKFQLPIAKKYNAIADSQSARNANLYLYDCAKKITPLAVALASDNDYLNTYAKNRASECLRLTRKVGEKSAFSLLCQSLDRNGVEPPQGVSEEGSVRRMCCERWWRRRIRKLQGREIESAAIDMGLVHNKAGIYCSNETLRQRRQQKIRNKELLTTMEAVNELGDCFTLQELADKSVSNPVLRRNELMTRMAGFEKVAELRGDVADFITVTCPSRMHARNSKSGIANEKYDGTKPDQANKYLQRVWKRIRAALARKGINLYGFRVAEPHHDATPHCHMLVFLPRKKRQIMRAIITKYAMQADGDEPGAKENRVNFKAIDKSKGTATGYISKYISKNIDGHGIDCDLYGKDATTSAERVDAWASRWGIRQFQQLGGPQVTIWRELRRMNYLSDGFIERVRQAADEGDWCGFVKLLGEPTQGRQSKIELVKHTKQGGRYGEAVEKIIGIQHGSVIVMTRPHEWTIKKSNVDNVKQPQYVQEKKFDERKYNERKQTYQSMYPWSSVNNCTRQKQGAYDTS